MAQQMMFSQFLAANMFAAGAGPVGGAALPSAGPVGGAVASDPEEAQRRLGRQVMANARAAVRRRAAEDDEDDPEGDEVAPGPSPNVHHPNYRPNDMELVPGLTDRRFEGRLTLWFEDKGYGFIESEEIKKMFPDMDVFLHQNQRRHFNRGDYVSFSVFLNFRGKPQGTELRRRKEPPAPNPWANAGKR